MTLPVFPNPISLNQVNVELSLAGTTLISLNQANVRTLAGVPTPLSTISMNNLHGKSNRVSLSVTLGSSAINLSTNIDGYAGYIAGITDVVINVAAVYLYANNTVSAGLTIFGGASGDTLTINNYGYIMGCGGNGGNGGVAGVATAGSAGGPAFSFNQNGALTAVLNNYGYILGGGGGGAGGGNGGSVPGYSGAGGGGPGAVGGNGNFSDPWFAGAGGGRIAPGSRTTPSSAASVGGSAGGSGGGLTGGRVGKYGGGPGEQGQQANIDTGVNAGAGGGGGGWGAAGGPLRSAFNTSEILAGGAAGAAILQNGRSVVIATAGAIYGAIV